MDRLIGARRPKQGQECDREEAAMKVGSRLMFSGNESKHAKSKQAYGQSVLKCSAIDNTVIEFFESV